MLASFSHELFNFLLTDVCWHHSPHELFIFLLTDVCWHHSHMSCLISCWQMYVGIILTWVVYFLVDRCMLASFSHELFNFLLTDVCWHHSHMSCLISCWQMYVGIILICVVTITGSLGYYQEAASSKIIESFKNMVPQVITQQNIFHKSFPSVASSDSSTDPYIINLCHCSMPLSYVKVNRQTSWPKSWSLVTSSTSSSGIGSQPIYESSPPRVVRWDESWIPLMNCWIVFECLIISWMIQGLVWVSVLYFQVDNSSLTGESEPQSRSPECTNPNPLETKNLAFFSTNVVEGSRR